MYVFVLCCTIAAILRSREEFAPHEPEPIIMGNQPELPSAATTTSPDALAPLLIIISAELRSPRNSSRRAQIFVVCYIRDRLPLVWSLEKRVITHLGCGGIL